MIIPIEDYIDLDAWPRPSKGGDAAAISEHEDKFMGESFGSRREVEQAIKTLSARPSSTRGVNTISAHFERSVVNVRYDTFDDLLGAINEFGITPDATQILALEDVAYAGWRFTTQNFKTMINTLFYVFTTLILFNVGFALVLAISPHYMASGPAGFFR